MLILVSEVLIYLTRRCQSSQLANDDGPPSPKFFPYIENFSQNLETTCRMIPVVLPDAPRSWISKAHFRGVLVQPR